MYSALNVGFTLGALCGGFALAFDCHAVLHVLLAFLFGTNTVMCIVPPMAAARGVDDVPTALTAVRLSSVFFVVSCPDHDGDARHGRLGHDRAGLARPRDRDGRRGSTPSSP